MKTILNFGSLNIDHVYTVKRFAKPGETIPSNNYEVFPGGKGLNQSIAFAKAGSKVYHAGKIGKDGHIVLDALKSNGVNAELIDTGGKYTGHALIQVSEHGENCIILFGGSNKEITNGYIDAVLSKFKKGDLLVIQNEINNIKYIVDEAYKKGMEIALNPSPIDENIKELDYGKITWLLLNEIEGNEITGETEPGNIVDWLIRKYKNLKIVLTLGADGVLYKDSANMYRHPIYNVEVVDTTGAGDTFTGFFLTMITNGKSIEKALDIATKASSIAISRKGSSSSIPLIGEVLGSLS